MSVFHKPAVIWETKPIPFQQVEYGSALSCELPLLPEVSAFPQQEKVCAVSWKAQQFPHGMIAHTPKLMENLVLELVLEKGSILKDWLKELVRKEYTPRCIVCGIQEIAWK